MRREGFEFEASLDYGVDPVLRNPKQKPQAETTHQPISLCLFLTEKEKKNVLGLKLKIGAEEAMAQWLKGLTAIRKNGVCLPASAQGG